MNKSETEIKNEKLIIFAWIVNYLGVPAQADPTKYNALVDKIYELMQFRPQEALGEIIDLKGPIVLVDEKHASEKLRMPHSASYSIDAVKRSGK